MRRRRTRRRKKWRRTRRRNRRKNKRRRTRRKKKKVEEEKEGDKRWLKGREMAEEEVNDGEQRRQSGDDVKNDRGKEKKEGY